MGTLTVRENLSFSAALRLSSSVKQNEKKARVDRLISELGLRKVADRRVFTHTPELHIEPHSTELYIQYMCVSD